MCRPHLLGALTSLSSKGPSLGLLLCLEGERLVSRLRSHTDSAQEAVGRLGQVLTPLWALVSDCVNGDLGWWVRRSLRALPRAKIAKG